MVFAADFVKFWKPLFLFHRLEAGKVWNQCRDIYLETRRTSQNWTNRSDKACVDVREIHQAAVSTDSGQAIVISGRGIRSLKRQRANLAKGLNDNRQLLALHILIIPDSQKEFGG